MIFTEPYTFTGPYARCYDVPLMAMDPRHVFIIHDILRSWPFKSALELGSFDGASSTAFIEAINEGSEMVATFCDVQLRPSLSDVIGNCTGHARMTKQPSVSVLDSLEEFDFILVDANHDLASVTQEVARLLVRKPLCVMAHDTNATEAGYQLAEGAKMLADTFRALPEYHCAEDAKDREGEQTNRGLFFATTDQELFKIAIKIFANWA